MLRLGHIRKSTSPQASPTIFVKKKDSSNRMCVDYRNLNAQTIKFAHPIPDQGGMINILRTGTVRTKMDALQGYHNMRISDESIPLTAFTTHRGLYEYLSMPFGLANAPGYFQRFMNEIFWDLLEKGVVIYIDDILIYTHTQAEHDALVREVLK